MDFFDRKDLSNLYFPPKYSSGGQNGQVTIIGGSSLFHGAPILALKSASKIVDMVFFASHEPSIGEVVAQIKSKLSSFIWVPWEEVYEYIKNSDAVLIGPGMMSYKKKSQKLRTKVKRLDSIGRLTREITKHILFSFPDKKWVIDAGSLQTMEAKWIPKGAVLTPNKKEFEILFSVSLKNLRKIKDLASVVAGQARNYKCIVVLKGPTTIVSDGLRTVLVKGGNAGLTKGGTGDVQAGVTVGLLAKNDPFLAACAASYIVKKTAENLYKSKGFYYNSEDLADSLSSLSFKASFNNSFK